MLMNENSELRSLLRLSKNFSKNIINKSIKNNIVLINNDGGVKTKRKHRGFIPSTFGVTVTCIKFFVYILFLISFASFLSFSSLSFLSSSLIVSYTSLLPLLIISLLLSSSSLLLLFHFLSSLIALYTSSVSSSCLSSFAF